MATTAERLKEIMKIRNMKQVDIIERTGINKGALSSYLSGRYLPKQDNIYKLSQVLRVNPAWLMGLDVPMEIPHLAGMGETNLSAESEKLAEAISMYNIYENASPEIKQSIDNLIELARKIPQVPQLDIEKLKSEQSRAEVPHLKKDKQ